MSTAVATMSNANMVPQRMQDDGNPNPAGSRHFPSTPATGMVADMNGAWTNGALTNGASINGASMNGTSVGQQTYHPAAMDFAAYDPTWTLQRKRRAATPASRAGTAPESSRDAYRLRSTCTRYSSSARKAVLRAMPDYLDGATVLKDILAKWQKAGTPHEILNVFQHGIPATPGSQDAAAIQKMGEELKQSGMFDKLRTQSIQVHKDTCTWGKMHEWLSYKRPQYTSEEIHNIMIDKLFTWHDSDYRANAQLLARLFNMETVIDMDYQHEAQQGLDKEVLLAKAQAKNFA